MLQWQLMFGDLVCRYHNVLFPITQYVCELIPDAQRDSTRVELYYEGALPSPLNLCVKV